MPLSYLTDRLSQTTPLWQLALTLMSCTTGHRAFFTGVCCAVFLSSLVKRVHVLQLQNKALPVGPVFFWERGLAIILPHGHRVSPAHSYNLSV